MRYAFQKQAHISDSTAYKVQYSLAWVIKIQKKKEFFVYIMTFSEIFAITWLTFIFEMMFLSYPSSHEIVFFAGWYQLGIGTI